MVDTDRPKEIVSHVSAISGDAIRARALRRAARARAAQFTWDLVLEILMDKIAFVAEATDAVRR